MDERDLARSPSRRAEVERDAGFAAGTADSSPGSRRTMLAQRRDLPAGRAGRNLPAARRTATGQSGRLLRRREAPSRPARRPGIALGQLGQRLAPGIAEIPAQRRIIELLGAHRARSPAGRAGCARRNRAEIEDRQREDQRDDADRRREVQVGLRAAARAQPALRPRASATSRQGRRRRRRRWRPGPRSVRG